MAVSEPYRDYVLEQLECIGSVTGKSMFGGVGLYLDRVFFALISADVLYFKVDETTRAEYETAGMKPFKPYLNRSMTMRYYEVPVDVLEDKDQLLVWAKKAWEVAKRTQEAK